MTDPVSQAITPELMSKIRYDALSIALSANAGNSALSAGEVQPAKLLYDAGVYLYFLLTGMPIDTVQGYVTAPKLNTPEVLAAAGVVTPAAEATPVKPKKVKLAAVPTSASAANSPSTAPVQAANPVQTAQAAVGSASTNLAQGNSTPQTIASPTTLAETAASLKALVQDDVRAAAGGYVAGKEGPPGRTAAVSLLTQFGVTQLGQIPGTKLAEFKAALDNVGKVGTAASPGSDLL